MKQQDYTSSLRTKVSQTLHNYSRTVIKIKDNYNINIEKRKITPKAILKCSFLISDVYIVRGYWSVF